MVALGDFLVLNVLLWAFIELTPKLVPSFFHTATKMTFLVANFSMLVSQTFYHTIIHSRRVNFEDVLSRVFKLTAFQAVVMYVMLRMIGVHERVLYFLALLFPTFFLLIMVARLIQRVLLKHYRQMGRNTRTVLFIGHDPAVRILYDDLMKDPSTGYRVAGYYADREIAKCPKELEWLGNLEKLNEKLDAEVQGIGVDDVFCCLSHDAYKEIINIMKYCDRTVTHFYYVPRMFGNFRLKLKAERFGDTELFTNYIEPLSSPINKFVKRAFDVCVSSVACLFIALIYPVIALCIKLQSPGPVLFKQQRTGLNGQTFDCFKFRSMHVNVESDKLQATKDDPRKFAFGNFMRKTNIDELPQFFNVLKGDMSVVGPRPHMLYHTDVYRDLIDKYMVRHFSKPGITGWAQITGFRGETKELWQMEERIKRDIWYIEHWSFWLDIKIILKTAIGFIIPDKQAY